MTEHQYFEHRLALHSFQIDRALESMGLPGRVKEGRFERKSGQDSIQFQVEEPSLKESGPRRSLRRTLLQSLTGFDIQIKQINGNWRIVFDRVDKPAVEFMQLYAELDPLPKRTAMLGWSPENQPVLLDLSQEENHHLLIAGSAKSGKTTLLRSLLTSIALSNRQSEVQLMIANSSTHALYNHTGINPFSYFPHLVYPPMTNGDELEAGIDFLLTEALHRQDYQINTPSILFVIDDIADFMTRYDDSMRRKLLDLAALGRETGIHLVCSTKHPDNPAVRPIWESPILARIVGKTESAALAELAADALDSDAEQLLSEGDFVAAVGDTLINFQAAFIEDSDLHFFLSQLTSPKRPVLVAQDFLPMLNPPDQSQDISYSVSFEPEETRPIESGREIEFIGLAPYESPNIWITPPPEPIPSSHEETDDSSDRLIVGEEPDWMSQPDETELPDTEEPADELNRNFRSEPDFNLTQRPPSIPRQATKSNLNASEVKTIHPEPIRPSNPPSHSTSSEPAEGEKVRSRQMRRSRLTKRPRTPIQSHTTDQPDIWAEGLLESDPTEDIQPDQSSEFVEELKYEPFDD